MKYKHLLFLIIFIFAVVVRFYNYNNRITFGSEQARSLYVSSKYIREKPTLLGQEYFRVTSSGHKLFSGAYFNYSLVPLLLLFDYDPYPITIFFTLLNLVTGFILFYLVNKHFNYQIAIFSTVLFLFNTYMIYHSMFIWILDYYPLLGLMFFYCIYKLLKKQTKTNSFIFGLFSGLGINLHYLFLPVVLFSLAFVFIKSRMKFKLIPIFLLGAILGNLPMFAFDLRHDLYHIRTFIEYILDVFEGSNQGNLTYYHFLFLWPVVLIYAGLFLDKIYKKSKFGAFTLLIIYLFFNLSSKLVNFSRPTGMPEGLRYQDIIKSSNIIAQDVNSDFNVASVLDFDKRGFILRYPLEFMYGKIPMGVEEYPTTSTLYVLSEKDYNFNSSDVWEINSLRPFDIVEISKIGNNYRISKVIKKI